MKTEISDRKYNEANIKFKVSIKIVETNLTFYNSGIPVYTDR